MIMPAGRQLLLPANPRFIGLSLVFALLLLGSPLLSGVEAFNRRGHSDRDPRQGIRAADPATLTAMGQRLERPG